MGKIETANLNEIEKFSSRASEWWERDGAFKTLHDINPTRLGFITEKVTLAGLQVLDIGCGGGILTEAMARLGANVTGLDASAENIAVAKNHIIDTGLDIHYVVDNVETHADQHEKDYDLITCMELLEHVPDPTSIIQACARMLKPKRHVIFSTINRNIKAYMLAVLVGEYLLHLLPKGTHHYKHFIRPSELVNWCKAHGLVLNDLKGLHYNPLLKRCHLNSDLDVNYLIDTIVA